MNEKMILKWYCGCEWMRKVLISFERMVLVNCKLIADSWKTLSELESNKENSPGWIPWQPLGVSTNPVSNKLAVVSSQPYKEIISCCLFSKLFVQPATTFQEIHALDLYFHYSHYEIQNMNTICRDAYITEGCLIAPWWHREKLPLSVQLGNVSW